VLVTGADLPNAVPYLVVIERLVAADVGHGAAVAVLLGYGVVYCLPCLVLLAVAAARGDRVRNRLRGVHDRIGRARTVQRSIPAALLLSAAAVGVATVAVTA
jgi:hypothetical protein